MMKADIWKVRNLGSLEDFGDLALTYIKMRDLNKYIMVPKTILKFERRITASERTRE